MGTGGRTFRAAGGFCPRQRRPAATAALEAMPASTGHKRRRLGSGISPRRPLGHHLTRIGQPGLGDP